MTQQEIVRRPHTWLTVWIYGLDISILKDCLENETMSCFPDELLEVYVPPTLSGYIFLRVATPSVELIQAVERMSGVGGVKNFQGKNPSNILRQQSIFFDLPEINCHDLVIVKIGPLRDHIGRVTAIETSGKSVEIELNIFGKMINTEFNVNEIQPISKGD